MTTGQVDFSWFLENKDYLQIITRYCGSRLYDVCRKGTEASLPYVEKAIEEVGKDFPKYAAAIPRLFLVQKLAGKERYREIIVHVWPGLIDVERQNRLERFELFREQNSVDGINQSELFAAAELDFPEKVAEILDL